MNMCVILEHAAGQILADRIAVDAGDVAKGLADHIVNEHIETLVPADAIDTGVSEAIDEISEATFAFAVDVISDRVRAEVEAQARQIALTMLRDVAAKAERAAAACSPDGGI